MVKQAKESKDADSGKPAETQGLLEKELKRIVQYISQVYQVQKKMGDDIKALDKRLGQLESALGKVMEAAGKAVSDSIAPLQSQLLEAISKQIQTTIQTQVLPQLKASQPAPSAAPTPAAPAMPASTPKTPKPTPTPTPAPTPSGPRRPSTIPDPRIATVIENMDNIIADLKTRQKVQREYLKPLLEQARDTAMNNLSSRATAASTFKELIALAKSSPFDVPPDIVAKVIAKLEELALHIRQL